MDYPEQAPLPITRVPPHDDDAELAVLGAMLFDHDALQTACETINADDFYRPDYKAVFDAMAGLFFAGKPVDIITLKSMMELNGTFDVAGGRDLLPVIAGSVSTAAYVKHYCQIVSDKATLRHLIKTADELSAASYEGTKSIDEIMSGAEKRLIDITQRHSTSEFMHVNEAILSNINTLEAAFKNRKAITGLSTGFHDLDRYTAGMHGSEFILIAARPGVGKTIIGLNIASHVAQTHRVPVAVFSLEMSNEQVAYRMLCTQSNVDASKLRNGSLTPEDWGKITEAVGPLSEAPIFLDDTPSITPRELRAKCRRLKLEHGLGLIIVDYLQLMRGNPGVRYDSRQNEVGDISRSLKAVARELDVPLLALAQLSRASAQKGEKPRLTDLRESGSIEQDADFVGLLSKEENADPENQNQIELNIAKQRNGETGAIKLMAVYENFKFTSAEWSGGGA